MQIARPELGTPIDPDRGGAPDLSADSLTISTTIASPNMRSSAGEAGERVDDRQCRRKVIPL